MKFMVLVKASAASEAGEMPSEKLIADMTRFNEQMAEAGVMLAGEGLHPSSKGARVVFDGSERKVVRGPFPETAQLVAGFWLIDVKSLDEAIEWVRRCPNPHEGAVSQVEIRQVFEAGDFGEAFTPELQAREEALRQRIGQA